MPNLSGPLQLFGQEVFSSSATPAHHVGAAGVTSDGRMYRYAKAGGADLVVGNALQTRVPPVSNSQAVTARVTAAGATSILMTANIGAIALNEYAGGRCVIESGPGAGYSYTIAGHAAIGAAANGALDLQNETVQVALTAASALSLNTNPYMGVVQHGISGTGTCIAGCVYPILANQYGWVQTGGPGAALIDGTPAMSATLTSNGTVAGSLTVHSGELDVVALMLVTGRNTKILPVYWLLW